MAVSTRLASLAPLNPLNFGAVVRLDYFERKVVGSHLSIP